MSRRRPAVSSLTRRGANSFLHSLLLLDQLAAAAAASVVTHHRVSRLLTTYDGCLYTRATLEFPTSEFRVSSFNAKQ